jgi:hypothetical protein
MAADFPSYDVGAIPPLGPDTPAELIDLLRASRAILAAWPLLGLKAVSAG